MLFYVFCHKLDIAIEGSEIRFAAVLRIIPRAREKKSVGILDETEHRTQNIAKACKHILYVVNVAVVNFES